MLLNFDVSGILEPWKFPINIEIAKRLARSDRIIHRTQDRLFERLEHLKLLEPLELLYPMLKATGYSNERDNEDYPFNES